MTCHPPRPPARDAAHHHEKLLLCSAPAKVETPPLNVFRTTPCCSCPSSLAPGITEGQGSFRGAGSSQGAPAGPSATAEDSGRHRSAAPHGSSGHADVCMVKQPWIDHAGGQQPGGVPHAGEAADADCHDQDEQQQGSAVPGPPLHSHPGTSHSHHASKQGSGGPCAGQGPRGGVQKRQRQEAGSAGSRKIWESEVTLEMLEEKVRLVHLACLLIVARLIHCIDPCHWVSAHCGLLRTAGLLRHDPGPRRSPPRLLLTHHPQKGHGPAGHQAVAQPQAHHRAQPDRRAGGEGCSGSWVDRLMPCLRRVVEAGDGPCFDRPKRGCAACLPCCCCCCCCLCTPPPPPPPLSHYCSCFVSSTLLMLMLARPAALTCCGVPLCVPQEYLPQYGDPARVGAVLEGARRELAPFLHTHSGKCQVAGRSGGAGDVIPRGAGWPTGLSAHAES
jgi:hypothetical protein